MTAAVEAKGLTLTLGEQRALREVSLRVERGGRLGVLGASGAGKTTLLRVLAGLALPQEGVVLLGGVEATRSSELLLPPERRGVGLVFQSLALWPHMTVERTLTYAARGTKLERRTRARDLAARVGLGARLDAFPDALSGGEQQRLAVARALASEPSVLLLDEPFAHLDAPLRHELGQAVANLASEQQVALILVTHQRQDVFQLAERLLVLEHGAVRDEGLLTDLVERPGHTATARLLGLGTVLEGAWRSGRVETALGALEVDRAQAEGPAQVLVRADRVALGSADSASGEGGVALDDARDDAHIWGTVRECAITRPDATRGRYGVRLEVSGAELRAASDRPWTPGVKVRVRVEGVCQVLCGGAVAVPEASP